MTKEEQRFTAAVAAMNGLLANNSSIFNTGGGDSIDCDNLASTSIAYADTLIKKLDNKVDYKEIPERPYVEDLLDSHIKKNEPLPPYEKDLFANSKNGDGKKMYDFIVADTVVTEPNPDARVVTKNQILNHRIK